MFRALRSIILLIFLVFVWWLISLLGFIDPLFLPDPLSTVQELLRLFNGQEAGHLLSTTYRALFGFILASVVAIPLGLVIGSYGKLYGYLELIIEFTRSLPATALFPLFLLYFGIGDLSKIFLITFTSFWVILTSTIYGAWQVNPVKLSVGDIYRASFIQKFLYIILPSVAPHIVSGLRNALPIALIVSVVVEMFVGTNMGLGLIIYNGYLTYNSAQLFAALLLTGLLGFLLNKTLLFASKKLIHWK